MLEREHAGDDFFVRTARAETAPRHYDAHPAEQELLALAGGDIPNDRRSELHAHLATCEECHMRWKRIHAYLQKEAVALDQRSVAPSLASTIRKRSVLESRELPWWRALWQPRAIVTVASAAAVVALTLGFGIPALQNSSQRTAEHIAALSSEIQILRNQVQWSGMISNGAIVPRITEELLNRYDWDDSITYRVEPGDTWQSIAEAELGDESLWPLVWFMNRDVGAAGDEIPVGTDLLIPSDVQD